MKSLLFWFLLLFSAGGFADEKGQLWNWYYAGFNSPDVGSGLFTRSGTARVEFSATKILIRFSEPALPNWGASFEGRIGKSPGLVGVLKDFFPSGSEAFSGQLNKMKAGKDCQMQEILLRPHVYDGSVLALSRIEGKCQ